MITLNERRIELYRRYENETRKNESSPVPRAPNDDSWLEQLLADENCVWKDILSKSDYVVGFIVLTRSAQDGAWYITDAYVDPPYRGRELFKETVSKIGEQPV